jgi:ribosomal protein S18 acetylase RimI-like enzyme
MGEPRRSGPRGDGRRNVAATPRAPCYLRRVPTPIHDWRSAIAFAAHHHGDDHRKGTRVPYLTHVLAVVEALAYHYPERDALIVAGVLHDVVEDTHATSDDVRERFGDEVADLVMAVSKDDAAMAARLGTEVEDLPRAASGPEEARALWRARREFLLHHLREPGVDPDVLRLKAADAIANLTSLLRDLRDPDVGAAVWSRFAVGRDDSLWYYTEVERAVRAGIGAEPLAARLRRVLADVAAEPGSGTAEPLGRFTLRRAERDDVDRVAPLFDAYRQFYGRPSDLPLARRFLEERLARRESIVLLATDAAGAGVGFVQLFPSHSSVRAARIFVLNDLFVAPSDRGAGVAKRLMRLAAETARSAGASRLTLRTQTNNRVAQGLYASLGWTRDDSFFTFDLDLEPGPP